MAGVLVPGEHFVLEAIAAERMPHRMVVSGVKRSPFFELRDYGAEGTRVIGVLNRHGIRAVLEEGGRFLFPFETLASREKAWRDVSVDAEWVGLRESVALKELAVFRLSAS
jgi:hypothetical protein